MPGGRFSRAEEISERSGPSSFLCQLSTWLQRAPRPLEYFTAKLLHVAQRPLAHVSAQRRLLDHAGAERGPGPAAAVDKPRSVTASLLCGAFPQWG